MKFRLAAAVVAAVVILTGCRPPVEITSEPGPAARPGLALERLFIVVDVPEIDAKTRHIAVPGADFGVGAADTMTFSDRFVPELATALGGAGVQTRAYVPAGGGPERAEIIAQAQAFGADGILWIFGKLIDFQLVELGTERTYTTLQERYGLDARILPLPVSDEGLWFGTLEVDVMVESWRAFAPEMAQALVGRLVADGLVGPPMAE